MSIFSFKKIRQNIVFVLPVSCSSCNAFEVYSCFISLWLLHQFLSLWMISCPDYTLIYVSITCVYLGILHCELPESCSSVRFTLFSGRVFLSVSCSLHFVSLAVEFNRVTKFKSSMVWRSLSYSSWQTSSCTIVFCYDVCFFCASVPS